MRRTTVHRTTVHCRTVHRTTVHRTAVAAAAAVILLAGCGGRGAGGTAQDGAGGGSGGSGAMSSAPATPPASGPRSSGPATPPAPVTPSTPGAPSGPVTSSAPGTPSAPGTLPPSSPAPTADGCVTRAELTAADNGRSLCLKRGGEVRITLDGTADRPWKPLTASGDALKPANPGFVILPGDAVAAYEAIAPGTARLTSSRPLCARTDPGQVSCLGIQNWAVAVRVR
ncbi:hypothetical protein ACWEKM_10680 [Streptomyces sp. NPDC004752]